MAHEQDQASPEAAPASSLFRLRKSCAARSPRYASTVRKPARVFSIILLADGMLPAFFSDTPERDTRIEEINSMR